MSLSAKERARMAADALKTLYPDAGCTLRSRSAYELMVAVRLSAQCTDKRVDTVTPAFFARYPTPEDLAEADQEEVEELIRPCGLYRSKARDLVGAAKKLTRDYGGQMPSTMEELLTLPGVGRKSANLLLGDIFHVPGAVVADTHCIRIANRLGLCEAKDPKRVEMALRDVLDPLESNAFCHRLVLFGREICRARLPQCDNCPLRSFCPSEALPPSQQ